MFHPRPFEGILEMEKKICLLFLCADNKVNCKITVHFCAVNQTFKNYNEIFNLVRD